MTVPSASTSRPVSGASVQGLLAALIALKFPSGRDAVLLGEAFPGVNVGLPAGGAVHR
jgi:hypothetical protein